MIEDWIKQHLNTRIYYTGSGTEIHICCPICGETRHRLYINLHTGQLYCHNCQFTGTVVKLIQYVERLSYKAAQERFNSIKGNMMLPDDLEYTLNRQLMGKEIFDAPKRPIPLPAEFQLIYASKNAVAQQAERYLLMRGITSKQIKQYKFGVCTRGEYANRIIIPIYQEKNLKFWVARAMNSKMKPKEQSPSTAFYQYGKSEVIFNLDQAAKNYHAAIISEGIFDAMSWGGVGVSLLGKSLYAAQFNLLLSYRNQLTEGLYIALDADAERDAMIIAEMLASFFTIKIIHIPSEFDDPNRYLVTHSKQKLWSLVNHAESFGEFTSLKNRLSLIRNNKS